MMVNLSSQDFLPEIEANEFIPPVSRWASFGGLFIVVSVGVAIIVASVTHYKITVKAQATVRPTGELQLVQAATDGTVMHILVQENQLVKKGDVIATLDDLHLQIKKSQLQNQIQQTTLQLTQLNGQIGDLDSQIVAERDRSQHAIASALAELDGSQKDYRQQKITALTEVQEAEANLNSSENESQKSLYELKTAEANFRSAKASLLAARTKLERYQTAATAGAISHDQLEEVRLAVDQQEQAVAAQQTTIEAQKQIIIERKHAISAAKAKLHQVEATINPVSATMTIASEHIAQEKASAQATLVTLDKDKKSLIQQRSEIQKQLFQNIHELQQLKIDIDQNTIKASVDGAIMKLNLRNPGQTVSFGEEIAQIIPSNAPLIIKAIVSPQHISKLRVGQQAQMQVSACPYPDYGTLKGLVSQVSLDTVELTENNTPIPNSITNHNKMSTFYEVTIKPNTFVLDKAEYKCTLRSGMQGRVDIISREESFVQFLLRSVRLKSNF
ncbi:HlyD family secretion protein [Nostoc sp. C117]|uniref:HlyD family secretion protein n=1 Tax=Nostoc sp. C117 TaxID=3349875 RepID=UPI00370D4785